MRKELRKKCSAKGKVIKLQERRGRKRRGKEKKGGRYIRGGKLSRVHNFVAYCDTSSLSFNLDAKIHASKTAKNVP